MDQFLLQRNFTTQIAGAHLFINIPDLTSGTGFKSYRIHTEDLLAGSGIVPLKLKNINTSTSQTLPSDTMLSRISVSVVSGTPTIKIGTTLTGNEILDTTTISGLIPIDINQYFANSTTLYFTVTGGTVNIRIDFQINYS